MRFCGFNSRVSAIDKLCSNFRICLSRRLTVKLRKGQRKKRTRITNYHKYKFISFYSNYFKVVIRCVHLNSSEYALDSKIDIEIG